MKLKIEYLAPDELVAYENNAKIHTAEQVEQSTMRYAVLLPLNKER